MSWFSDIAGKAETLLNKMDKTVGAVVLSDRRDGDVAEEGLLPPNDPHAVSHSMARTSSSSSDLITLQSNPRQNPTPSGSGLHSRSSSLSSSFSTISTRELNQNNGSGNGNGNGNGPGNGNGREAKERAETSRDDDEKLFEFLNSKDTSPQPARGRPLTPPVEMRKEELVMSKEANLEEMVASVSSDEEKESGKSTPRMEMIIEKVPPTVEEQNEKLRQEIHSLTTQIGRLTKRNVETETELKRLTKRIENWQVQMGSSDASLRELQARESDLKANINAKNAQLGVLRIRLQERDEEIKVKQDIIERIQMENDILLKEKDEKSVNFDENLESLRNRAADLEEEVYREKEALRCNQSESMLQMGRYEETQKQLVDEMANIQKELRQEKGSNKELEKLRKQLVTSYESLETEFNDYKLRAQKTLQSKDELLKAFQKRTRDGGEEGDDSDQVDAGSVQINRVLQSQCDSLVVEVQELRNKNDLLKKQLDKLRDEEMDALSLKISSLQENLDEEKRLKQELDQELRQTQDELKYFQDDLRQTKNNLTERINDRDTEIEKLRKQLVSKRSSTNGNSIQELESRVKSLTENLISKQTIVEQLTSERHSLALQLERSDARLRDALTAASSSLSSSSGSVSIGMVHSSSASNLVNRVKPFIEESPMDGQVTRRVKRAYGQLDAFSVRLGMFLRAYPSARAMVILYIIILHIWVFFILFNYRPEIHPDGPERSLRTPL